MLKNPQWLLGEGKSEIAPGNNKNILTNKKKHLCLIHKQIINNRQWCAIKYFFHVDHKKNRVGKYFAHHAYEID